MEREDLSPRASLCAIEADTRIWMSQTFTIASQSLRYWPVRTSTSAREAGKRQVDGAEIALTHNIGGIGQSAS